MERRTDGEVFSFSFVTEQRPGVAEGVKTHRCKHGGRVIQTYGRHSRQGMCSCRVQIHGRHLVRVGWELQHASLVSSLPRGQSRVLRDAQRLGDVSR